MKKNTPKKTPATNPLLLEQTSLDQAACTSLAMSLAALCSANSAFSYPEQPDPPTKATALCQSPECTRNINQPMNSMTTPIQQPPGDATVAQSTATNQNPSQEATVDARLLHAYVGHPLSYDPWIAGVRRMDSSRYARTSGHRVFDFDDGKTGLSYSFACELALPGGTFAEAIPLIIIAESPRAPQGTVNAQLRRFHSVVVAGGLSDARRLHEFLQVRQDYDGWITSKRKQLGMKSGRDYHRLPIGDIKPGYWPNEPHAMAKDIAVTFAMAQEIAIRETTPRGEHVRQYVESYQRAYSAWNERYESVLH